MFGRVTVGDYRRSGNDAFTETNSHVWIGLDVEQPVRSAFNDRRIDSGEKPDPVTVVPLPELDRVRPT